MNNDYQKYHIFRKCIYMSWNLIRGIYSGYIHLFYVLPVFCHTYIMWYSCESITISETFSDFLDKWHWFSQKCEHFWKLFTCHFFENFLTVCILKHVVIRLKIKAQAINVWGRFQTQLSKVFRELWFSL